MGCIETIYSTQKAETDNLMYKTSSKDSAEDFMKGNSFISFDYNPDNIYYLFFTKSKRNNILSITRNNPSIMKDKYGKEVEIYWMSQKEKERELLEEIKSRIDKVIKKQKSSIIILERLDYLITVYGFETVLRFIYSINDSIINSSAVFVIHTHPQILNEQQKTLLSMELKEMPRPEFVEKIKVAKDLFEILEYLNSTSNKVSFKTVCKKFDITKATARKRIYDLYNKSLVMIKKDGRSKIIELTKKGMQVLV